MITIGRNKIRLLMAVKGSIVDTANTVCREEFGSLYEDVFSTAVTKDTITWYVTCGYFSVQGLISLKQRISNQIELGNLIIWTRKGRVKLTEEGYVF